MTRACWCASLAPRRHVYTDPMRTLIRREGDTPKWRGAAREAVAREAALASQQRAPSPAIPSSLPFFLLTAFRRLLSSPSVYASAALPTCSARLLPPGCYRPQELSELEEMFSWLKINLPESADGGSHPWIVKMWEALIEMTGASEPTPEGATNPTKDTEADAPVASSIVATPSEAPGEKAVIAAEEAISSPAPPLPPGALLSRTQSIHVVEGSSLTLESFVKWYNRVTSEFKPAVRTQVLETLEDYVAKMCKADRLFKLWDHDGSGTLEHNEIVSVLSWFEKHIPGDDIEFATIWDADKEAETAAVGEPETAENAKAMEDPEAPAPAPVAVTGKAVKHVPLRKMFNPMTAIDNAFAGFPQWIASVVASLTPVVDATATPTMNPMAQFLQSDKKASLKLTTVQFRRWLMSVAGQLEASTYVAALDQLCGASHCAHRTKTAHRRAPPHTTAHYPTPPHNAAHSASASIHVPGSDHP